MGTVFCNDEPANGWLPLCEASLAFNKLGITAFFSGGTDQVLNVCSVAPMNSMSPPLQAVLQLFQGPLADVRFADIDAAGLASITAEVESAADAVAQQEAQLSELRQTLVERQDALLLLAQRALAYARVYAEHDDALTEQLARISLPRPAKPRKANPGKAADAAAAESVATDVAAPEKPESRIVETVDALPDEPEAEAAPAEPAPRKGKRRGNGAAAHEATR